MDTANDLGRVMHSELSRLPRGRPWRVAIGRAHPSLYGIARSYEVTHEALTMAGRLHVDMPVVNAHDLLIYRFLLSDQPAIVDLIRSPKPLGCAPASRHRSTPAPPAPPRSPAG